MPETLRQLGRVAWPKWEDEPGGAPGQPRKDDIYAFVDAASAAIDAAGRGYALIRQTKPEIDAIVGEYAVGARALVTTPAPATIYEKVGAAWVSRGPAPDADTAALEVALSAAQAAQTATDARTGAVGGSYSVPGMKVIYVTKTSPGFALWSGGIRDDGRPLDDVTSTVDVPGVSVAFLKGGFLVVGGLDDAGQPIGEEVEAPKPAGQPSPVARITPTGVVVSGRLDASQPYLSPLTGKTYTHVVVVPLPDGAKNPRLVYANFRLASGNNETLPAFPFRIVNAQIEISSTLSWDDFVGADGTTVQGTRGWTRALGPGSLTIQSNRARISGSVNTSTPCVFLRPSLNSPDMWAECTLEVPSSVNNYPLMVRASADGLNGYAARWNTGGGGRWEITAWVAGALGAAVGLMSQPTQPPAGTRMRLEAEGSIIRLKVNGRTVISVTDATITSGNYAGILGRGTTVLLWDFACGRMDAAQLSPVYFGGTTSSRDLFPGAVENADPLSINVPPGHYAIVRTTVETDYEGWQYSCGRQSFSDFGEGFGAGDFASSTSLPALMAGAVFAPVAIVGEPTRAAPKKSAAIIGSSSAHGQAAIEKVPFGALGYVELALAKAGVAYYRHSFGGQRISTYLASRRWRGQMPIRAGVPLVHFALGSNDSFNGAAVTTMLRLTERALDGFAAEGRKAILYTLTPRNTSTDGWATLENQTVLTEADARRTAWNAELRAGAFAGHPGFAGYLDPALTAEEPTAPGKWRTDLGIPTDDGTHANQVIVEAIADALVATVKTLHA